MTIDLGTLIAIAVPTVGAIVWLVRLEGRVNMGEASVTELRDDVRYIRERIDRALNGRE